MVDYIKVFLHLITVKLLLLKLTVVAGKLLGWVAKLLLQFAFQMRCWTELQPAFTFPLLTWIIYKMSIGIFLDICLVDFGCAPTTIVNLSHILCCFNVRDYAKNPITKPISCSTADLRVVLFMCPASFVRQYLKMYYSLEQFCFTLFVNILTTSRFEF